MEMCILEGVFCVCKLADLSVMDLSQKDMFLSITDEEISLVCREECVPGNTLAREDHWKCFKIKGVLDFSLLGILARIASALAKKEISIFVVSTFNTDYIFVKANQALLAKETLEAAGLTFDA